MDYDSSYGGLSISTVYNYKVFRTQFLRSLRLRARTKTMGLGFGGWVQTSLRSDVGPPSTILNGKHTSSVSHEPRFHQRNVHMKRTRRFLRDSCHPRLEKPPDFGSGNDRPSHRGNDRPSHRRFMCLLVVHLDGSAGLSNPTQCIPVTIQGTRDSFGLWF